MQHTFTLTGRTAVFAIIGVVLVLLFIRELRQSSLDTDGRRALNVWLTAEHGRARLPEIEAAVARARPGDPVPEAIQRLQEPIAIEDIETRGLGSKVIVRARVQLPGGAEQVRYFRMRHSMVTGWIVQGN